MGDNRKVSLIPEWEPRLCPRSEEGDIEIDSLKRKNVRPNAKTSSALEDCGMNCNSSTLGRLPPRASSRKDRRKKLGNQEPNWKSPEGTRFLLASNFRNGQN